MGTAHAVRASGCWERVRQWNLTPGRITGIYLLVGTAGLYASAVVLPELVASRPRLVRLQLLAGALEVALTAGLIFALTSGSHATLASTTEHLATARRELSVLHRILRHDLRNDLTVVAGHAADLEDEVEAARLADRCEAIRDSCRDLLTSSEKARLVADVNREDAVTAEVALAPLVEAVAERSEGLAADATVETAVEGEPVVQAHEYVRFTVQELVGNAIEHSDGPAPTVSVTVREAPSDDGWWEVVVADDGPGIPAGEIEGLHVREEPLAHASGVGLWVAGWIVYRSGGEFDVENTEDGCRVTVSLPSPAAAAPASAAATIDRFLA